MFSRLSIIAVLAACPSVNGGRAKNRQASGAFRVTHEQGIGQVQLPRQASVAGRDQNQVPRQAPVAGRDQNQVPRQAPGTAQVTQKPNGKTSAAQVTQKPNGKTSAPIPKRVEKKPLENVNNTGDGDKKEGDCDDKELLENVDNEGDDDEKKEGDDDEKERLENTGDDGDEKEPSENTGVSLEKSPAPKISSPTSLQQMNVKKVDGGENMQVTQKSRGPSSGANVATSMTKNMMASTNLSDTVPTADSSVPKVSSQKPRGSSSGTNVANMPAASVAKVSSQKPRGSSSGTNVATSKNMMTNTMPAANLSRRHPVAPLVLAKAPPVPKVSSPARSQQVDVKQADALTKESIVVDFNVATSENMMEEEIACSASGEIADHDQLIEDEIAKERSDAAEDDIAQHDQLSEGTSVEHVQSGKKFMQNLK